MALNSSNNQDKLGNKYIMRDTTKEYSLAHNLISVFQNLEMDVGSVNPDFRAIGL